MATGKRFFWLKLKREFMTGDEVDFLMSQKHGANYVVLYQMLCLATINTGGSFSRTIGEAVIPYDIDKITREGKWFDRDTVIVALELYKKLGLVYEQENGILQIADFKEIVGSETDWAAQKQRQRLEKGVDNVHGNVPELSTPMSTQENREKSIEKRDQIYNSINHSAHAHTREEIDPPSALDIAMGLDGEEARRELEAHLREQLKRKYIGKSRVIMSGEQFDSLVELLSLEELDHYLEVIDMCERNGKSYRGKTHYQAILNMAEKDRRVVSDAKT